MVGYRGSSIGFAFLVTFTKFLTLPGARALTPRRGGPLPASLAPGLDPAPEELSPVLSLCVVPPQGGVSVGSRDGSASSLGPVYSGSTGSAGRSTQQLTQQEDGSRRTDTGGRTSLVFLYFGQSFNKRMFSTLFLRFRLLLPLRVDPEFPSADMAPNVHSLAA